VGQGRGSTAVDFSRSSSSKTSDSLTKTSLSGGLGTTKATEGDDLKPTALESDVKGKGSKQRSSTKVMSAHQKASEKQTVSARGNSRPASSLSVYVSYITL